MRFYFIKVLIPALMLMQLSISAADKSGDDKAGVYGIQAGYPSIFGHYSRELYGYGSFGLFYVPYGSGIFFVETGLNFTGHTLKESENSVLYRTGLSFSPSLIIAEIGKFSLYSFLTAGGEYVYLSAEITGRHVSSFKPSAGAGAGIIFDIGSGFSVRANAAYSFIILSNQGLHSLNYYAAAAYSPGGGYTGSGDPEAREARRLVQSEKEYSLGVERYRARDLAGAKIFFKKAVSLRPRYPDAERYLDEINEISIERDKASEYAAAGKLYEALAVLEKISGRSTEAETELNRIRALLKAESAPLVNEGIAAYNARDYSKCAALMKRVLLIDPDNASAKIYLSRSQKRLDALQKLK